MVETESPMLTMLKTDLVIKSTTAYDRRLCLLLTTAQQMIRGEGVSSLDTSDPKDMQLIVLYAAWMWRRRDDMQGMPRMLRWALNNRIFAEKAGASHDS